MATIYDPPKSIAVPGFDFSDMKKSKEQETAFLKQVGDWCKANSKDHKDNDKYIGSVYRIPMGDGYALYAILSLKPVKLVHLPVGDAWDSPFARRASATMIKTQVDGDARIEKLFSRAKTTNS